MSHRYDFPRKPLAKEASVVSGDKYRFTLLTDGLLRYEWADDGVFEDRASTLAIYRDLPVPRFKTTDQDGYIEIDTARFHLRYDKSVFSQRSLAVQAKGNITDWKSNWRYGGGLKDEDYYLYGTARTLDEANGRIPLGPGVIARNGFANLDDSESMLFTEGGWIAGRRPAPAGGTRIDGYLFAYGLDYKEAIKAFFALSGRPPLLPRWSLGNWWSRYYAYTADGYLKLMKEFRQRGIPLSVGVLDMDWHLISQPEVKKSGFSGWTGYTWDKNLFPDPPKFLQELHEMRLHTCPNDHPADGIAPYEEQYENMCRALQKDSKSGDAISFAIELKPFNDAYFDSLLRAREDDGIDFWWVDWQQGPYSTLAGVDPLWVLNHYHFLNNKRGEKRPITFSRYAGPGSHRYPVGFSGDSVVSWESLQFQPEFTATSSNIGYGWWSHDIGGHMMGYRDDELATRWVQYGVWSPINRLHSTNNAFNRKEPWQFSPEAERAMSDHLRLRHQLVPYLYSMNVLSARDGEPLVQPLYWKYPTRLEAYEYRNTYYFGTQLLLAPATTPRSKVTNRSAVPCWLPPGQYVDVFRGQVYTGDRHITFHPLLDEVPVLAKEGSILALDASSAPQNGCPSLDAFHLKVVVGKSGRFDLYEDDDTGSSLEKVELFETAITWDQEAAILTVSAVLGRERAIPRAWDIDFVGLDENAVEGLESCIGSPDAFSNWMPVTASVTDFGIYVESLPQDTSKPINLRFAHPPRLRTVEPYGQAYPIIEKAQVPFDDKNKINDILNSKRSLAVQVGELNALNIDEDLKGAMMELLLADERVFSLK